MCILDNVENPDYNSDDHSDDNCNDVDAAAQDVAQDGIQKLQLISNNLWSIQHEINLHTDAQCC